MPIASDHPETGVRIAIERDKANREAPWSYAGSAFTPDAKHPITVVVDAEGNVSVEAPKDLVEKIRLIVRAVYKQAKADEEPPAWRILRWRADR